MPSFLFSIPACISIFPPLNTITPHLRLSVLYMYARPLLLPGSCLLPTYLPTYLQLPIQCPNQQQANKTTQPHHNLNICLSTVGTRILRKQPKPHVYPPLAHSLPPSSSPPPSTTPPPPGDSPYSSPSIKKHIINKIDSNSTLKTTSSSSTIKKSLFRTCRDLKKNAWLEQPKPPFLFFPKLARCPPPFPHLFFFRKLEYTPSHHSILTVPHFPKRPLRCASGRAVAGG